jgi:hypothetical protein
MPVGISVPTIPVVGKPSPPASSCQRQVALGPLRRSQSHAAKMGAAADPGLLGLPEN